MLRLSCSLDATKDGIHLQREVQAGGHFDVALIAEHVDGDSKSTVFDTAILEILYNDKNFVLFTDSRSHPIAGEVAHASTRDYFSREAAPGGKRSDPNFPFSKGTMLTLRPPTGDSSGPYKTATGYAGITGEKPFEVHAGKPVVMMAGRVFAIKETAGGESSLVLSGNLYHGSRPIATESVVSTVRVVPLAERKAFDV
jgi:hypothetical protein